MSSKASLKHSYNLENDPHRVEELKKYKDPIPSREVILDILNKKIYPCSFEVIAEALDITSNKKILALSYRLKAMIRDDQIVKLGIFFGCKNYIPLSLIGMVYFNSEGQALVQNEEMNINAALITTHKKIVFKGDIVVVEIIGINKNQIKECCLKEIKKRNLKYLIGRYDFLFGAQIFKPLNKEYESLALLPTKQRINKDSILKAKIIAYPSIGVPGIAKIVEIYNLLDEENTLEKVISIIKDKYNLVDRLEDEFSEECPKQPIPLKDLKNRVDLTHLPFITIDGENAQDLDDAICAVKDTENSKDWVLYVAIADVSHYVKRGSTLDYEARLQSSSMYFPQHTIHMLPKQLSVHMCSLKPGTEKLVLVCEIKINHLGKMKQYKFYPSYIQSRAQLTYKEVSSWLTRNVFPNKIIEEIIKNLHSIHLLFTKQRQNYGAIYFDRESTHLEFGTDGLLQNIWLKDNTIAHKIIEECMIFANQACAQFLLEKLEHAIFRVNFPPTEEKINNLKNFLKIPSINLHLKGKKVFSKNITKLLNQARNKGYFATLQLMVIRSMTQAFYSPKNIGHFALALPAYTHFTSPIRRYADLVVHRMVKDAISTSQDRQYSFDDLKVLCEYISTQSRQIDLATNEVEHIMKCLFMNNYIGHSFIGTIIGSNDNSILVNINKYHIDGLIKLEDIMDKKSQYLPGNKIEVIIDSVDLSYHKIYLKIKSSLHI